MMPPDRSSDGLRIVAGLDTEDSQFVTRSEQSGSGLQAGGGEIPPPSIPDDQLRKFRAKRHNEHMKAIYSVTNTLGAAVVGAAYILPEIQGVKVVQELDRPSWIVIGLTVIAGGHTIIRWGWRRED